MYKPYMENRIDFHELLKCLSPNEDFSLASVDFTCLKIKRVEVKPLVFE